MNPIKQLSSDLGRLSRGEFGLKYFVPAIGLFLTYGTIGQFYQSCLSLDDLKKQTGAPLSINIRFLQGIKSGFKYYPLYIQLDNFPEEFRLMDVYKDHFNFIQQQINPAGEITIYYRTRLQTILGFGKRTDILQINQGNETIFPIETITARSRKTSLVTLILSIFTWALYYFLHVRKRQSKNA